MGHKGICSLCCICVDNFISETVQRVQSSFFLSFWNCPVYLFTCFSLEVKCYVNYAFPDIWIMYESPIAFTSCHKIPKYPPNFWYFFHIWLKLGKPLMKKFCNFLPSSFKFRFTGVFLGENFREEKKRTNLIPIQSLQIKVVSKQHCGQNWMLKGLFLCLTSHQMTKIRFFCKRIQY